MHKSQVLLICLLSIIIGIFVGNFFTSDNFILFCSLLFLIFFLIVFKNRKSRLIILMGIFLILGLWRYQASVVNFEINEEKEFIGQVVKVDERIDHQKLTIKTREVKGLVLVSADLYPEYSYGDELKIKCYLQNPEPFNDFDYEKYLARYNIYSICWAKEIDFMAHDLGIKKNIFDLKNKLSHSLNFSIKEPQVSILQAMILGNRRSIPPEISEKFSDVGISHIIAISGLHIAIIANIFLLFFIGLGLKRPVAFWVASFGIILYVIMIGAPASAVRASIMVILVLYAQKIGRLSSAINVLILTATTMLLFNPKLLLSDVGFQLSFMAVLGIIYLYPILKKYFECWPDIWRWKDIITVTLSAQIMTLPLIIFYFKKVSLVAVAANVLILPMVPFLIMWGLANAIIGAFWLSLSRLMGFISYLGVSYILTIADKLSALPFSYLEIKNMNILVVIGLYVLIIFWIIREKKRLMN